MLILYQSVANIFFGTEYEYEYIRNVLFSTNTNIFGIIFWTEYEYEYIRNTTVDWIRIFEYFWLKYSNIFGSNIRIFFAWIFEYFMEQIGNKVWFPRIQRSQLCYLLCQSYSVVKLSPVQSSFNLFGWTELAFTSIFTPTPPPNPTQPGKVL